MVPIMSQDCDLALLSCSPVIAIGDRALVIMSIDLLSQ